MLRTACTCFETNVTLLNREYAQVWTLTSFSPFQWFRHRRCEDCGSMSILNHTCSPRGIAIINVITLIVVDFFFPLGFFHGDYYYLYYSASNSFFRPFYRISDCNRIQWPTKVYIIRRISIVFIQSDTKYGTLVLRRQSQTIIKRLVNILTRARTRYITYATSGEVGVRRVREYFLNSNDVKHSTRELWK